MRCDLVLDSMRNGERPAASEKLPQKWQILLRPAESVRTRCKYQIPIVNCVDLHGKTCPPSPVSISFVVCCAIHQQQQHDDVDGLLLLLIHELPTVMAQLATAAGVMN